MQVHGFEVRVEIWHYMTQKTTCAESKSLVLYALNTQKTFLSE